MKHLLTLFLGACISVLQLSAQIKVSFSEVGQTVNETDSLRIAIELEEASLLEVSVPYVISGESTMVLDTDYEIEEDDEDSDFDNESPIVFEPGETLKYITVTLLNDDETEGDEFLIFDLVADGLTVAQLGDVTRHTVRVIDNDAIEVNFLSHSAEVYESSNISIPIRLTSDSEQEVEVHFEIDLVTADSNDVDLTNSYTTDSPLTINDGVTAGSIGIKVVNDSITDANEGGADEEIIRVRITSANLADTGEALPFDPEPFEVTLIDNDPLTVEFDYDDDTEMPIELEEYESSSVRLILLDRQGNASSAGAEIQVPISYGGTATRGTDDTADYESEDDVITIPSGNSTYTFTLLANNDDDEEGDETISLAIGDAFYTDGGDLWVGDKKTVDFLVLDNDPITLSFGAVYSKDDEAAAEDPDDDIEDVLFVDSSGFVVSEAAGTVSIPFYLSSISANNVEFDLELKSDGTNATLFDSSIDADDQDWDFAVTNVDLSEFDKAVTVTLRAGLRSGSITLTLNNDDETPIVFGEEPAADVEGDEQIKFSISNLNTADSSVNMGASNEFSLTVRDLPDIDITHLMNGLSPVASELVGGTPRFNDLTALFEVYYEMNLNQTLNPDDFPGYRSLKVQYRTSNYDASNPDAEGNDPLLQSPFNPDDGVEFHYFVQTPFQLRYASNTEIIRLIDNDEPENDDEWDVSTADTIELAPYFLKPLTFPRLNDFEALIEDAYDINEPLNWWVDFYSNGYLTMPLDRIDPASNENRMRVYLTTESTPVLATGTSTLTIRDLEPQSDGSMLLTISSSSASGVQIQYLDPGEEWKIAQPANISTGGASLLHWVDKGPPATETHPSNVQFRLYRATSN